MELSIDQLAELKIAIEKSSVKERELNTKVTELEWMYNHYTWENKRLENEIKQQIEIKENLIKENNDIRKEKETIQWEYEKRNQENYKKISETQAKLDETKWLIDLRLIEVEKREADLNRKIEENETLIKDVKKIKQEIWEERLVLEWQIKEIQNERQKSIEETERKLKAIQELEEKEKDFEKQRENLNKKMEENAKQLNEINAKYIEIKAQEKYFETILPKIETFKDYLKETKDFVINSKNATKEQINKINEIATTIDNTSIPLDIPWETTTEWETNVDYTFVTVAEIKTLLNEAWIKYNKNNNNKESLIKLLNS